MVLAVIKTMQLAALPMFFNENLSGIVKRRSVTLTTWTLTVSQGSTHVTIHGSGCFMYVTVDFRTTNSILVLK